VQQLIGMKTGLVERVSSHRRLRLLGRVTLDENRVHRVTTVGDGWIRELSPAAVGSRVEKGQRLASYYAPRFLAAQQAYFYALNTLDRLQAGTSEGKDQNTATRSQLQAAVDNLRALGMDEAQIAEISHTRLPSQDVWVSAPATGFIVARNISPGLRFDRGSEFYRIADLSQVWIQADVFEHESDQFLRGDRATVSLPHQQKTFRAVVSDILPQFDGTTRTLKVRLDVDNPEFLLRPDMFVDVEWPVTLASAIVLPVDAVVDSGVKKTVYVDKGDGIFEPRQVETGWRAGDRVEIVKGLMPGEKIVVSGTFLIDSESRMKAAATGIYGETSAVKEAGSEREETAGSGQEAAGSQKPKAGGEKTRAPRVDHSHFPASPAGAKR
jgi:RND family efflux transporter MFP subunit